MLRNLGILFLCIFLFTGCGGGGSSSEEVTSDSKMGIFVDDTVSGIKYLNNGLSGFTDVNGSFPYTDGLVEFFIGSIKIGEISSLPSDGNVFIQDIVGVDRSDTSDKKVLKIAILLQTLDSNTLTDEIEIKKNDFNKFNSSSGDIDDIDVNTLLTNKGFSNIVSEENAKRHMSNVLKSFKIVEDSEIFELKTSSIANGESSIVLNADIVLTFTKDFKKESINSSSIILEDTNGIIIPFSTSSYFNVLTVMPNDNFDYSSSYTLTLKELIKDFGNNSLSNKGDDSNLVFSFTTIDARDITAPVLSSITQTFTTTVGTALDLETVTANDNKDKETTVIQSGIIDFNTVGTYDIVYTSTDSSSNTSTITHTYIVSEADTTAPVLSSITQTFTTIVGTALDLETVTANDNKDKETTVIQSGTVDFNTVGIYDIVYTSTDSSSNSSSIKHKYIVSEFKSLSFYTKNTSSSLVRLTAAGYAIGISLSSDGTKVYIAGGKTGLQIIDITTPSTPVLLGTFDTSGYTEGVTLSSDGTKAYLADGSGGLQILDITTPSLPVLLGTYDTVGSAYEVTLSSDGTKAYIADDSEGLQIIDITTPSSPVLLGTYDTTGYARGISLSSDGTKAYIADGRTGLQIIDVTTPSSPVLLGTYNTADYARKVRLSSDGTKAYIADYSAGLQILDITTPSLPVLLGTYDTVGSAYEVSLSSDGTKAYVTDDSVGLQIIDITTSATPVLLRTYVTFYTKGVILSSDGTKAYLANGIAGLEIVDISTSATPVLLGKYDTVHSAYEVTLSSDGTKAYLANGIVGLQIIDITTPATPVLLKTYGTFGDTKGVTLSSDGTKAYLADGSGGLQIIDITTPAAPILIGTFNTFGYTEGVTLSSDGTKAYLADGSGGLLIIDITTPSTPILRGIYDPDGYVGAYNRDEYLEGVTLSSDGTKAYLIYGDAGLQIIDITTPSTPILLGVYDTNGSVREVILSSDGTKAYIANGSAGLQILDITTPSAPILLGTYDIDGYAAGVTISNDGTKAYIAGSPGLRIIDITTPSKPNLLRTYYSIWSTDRVILSSDETKAYATDRSTNLQIIDITLDTLYKEENFEKSSIDININTNNTLPLALEISANRDDIVAIGSYDADLTFDEYKSTTISIPVESIKDKRGQTIITLTLSDGTNIVKRTVYLNVYP